MLGNLIGGFITILVGTSLLPQIGDAIWEVTHNSTNDASSNVTGATLTVISLMPLFYSLGIMSAGVAITVGGLRNAGVM